LPPVANVFQTVPHPPKNGSGVPKLWQDHTLDAVGVHSHSGQRIRLKPSSSSISSRILGTKIGFEVHLNIWSDMNPSIVH
jgi:hypothetical protein